MTEEEAISSGSTAPIPLPIPIQSEDYFRQSSSIATSSSPSSSINGYVTQAFPFSSGNPRIEETRGVMHLFLDDATASSSSNLPVKLIALFLYGSII